MKNKPKPKKPASTIPAWTCPTCGRTHPITVQTCECGPKNPAQYPKPYTGPQWWGYPQIWCGTAPRKWDA